jgi:hypothetical protein
LDKKCLTHFFNVTANIGADIVLGNFAYWNGKNRCKKIKTILNIRSKKWNISTKNINKFKTPYLMPLGKFYARQIFYQIKNLSEHTYYQDVNLYYQSLFLAKNIYFINKNLALYRSNRKDSSSNMNWSEKKLNNWINTITFINNHDNAIGGIFYLLVKGFKNAYTLKYSQPLKIKGKIKVTYLPKIFYVPIWIFIKIILFSYRRVLILAK